MPGAPAVVVLGYDLWQRSLGGRPEVVGSIVQFGGTPATVIGVMPEGFAYPYNQQAWAPLQLRASYGPLEGEPLSVIGRLAPGVTRERADAELRVLNERAASALPDTHAQLRSRVVPLSRRRREWKGAVRGEKPAGAARAARRVHERGHTHLRAHRHARG